MRFQVLRTEVKKNCMRHKLQKRFNFLEDAGKEKGKVPTFITPLEFTKPSRISFRQK